MNYKLNKIMLRPGCVKIMEHRYPNEVEVNQKGAIFCKIPAFGKESPLRVTIRSGRDGYGGCNQNTSVMTEEFMAFISEKVQLPDNEFNNGAY
jgi:hypothetical protein